MNFILADMFIRSTNSNAAALLSDIFEIHTDCRRKAHAMKSIPIQLSHTPSRLMTVRKSGGSFQITECHLFIPSPILSLLEKKINCGEVDPLYL